MATKQVSKNNTPMCTMQSHQFEICIGSSQLKIKPLSQLKIKPLASVPNMYTQLGQILRSSCTYTRNDLLHTSVFQLSSTYNTRILYFACLLSEQLSSLNFKCKTLHLALYGGSAFSSLSCHPVNACPRLPQHNL